MEQQEEHFFTCPYCGSRISMVLDMSMEAPQDYIEDCEVCCQPIEVHYDVKEDAVVGFDSRRMD